MIKTHPYASPKYVGEPIEVDEGVSAKACLMAIDEMAVDSSGLIHGGFTFGLADYSAMLAVNHPNVVLGSAQSRFIAPVKVGDLMIANATVKKKVNKRSDVEVKITVKEREVFTGLLSCYALDEHVLSRQL